MSVIVNHKTFGDVTSPEFDAGEELKKKFQDFFLIPYREKLTYIVV